MDVRFSCEKDTAPVLMRLKEPSMTPDWLTRKFNQAVAFGGSLWYTGTIRLNDYLIIKLKGVITVKKTYKIEVDCAHCAAKMEEAAKKTQGVADAVVNFMTQKLIVTFDEGVDVKATMEAVYKNCKVIEDDCVIYL